jgi:hypothetical protein
MIIPTESPNRTARGRVMTAAGGATAAGSGGPAMRCSFGVAVGSRGCPAGGRHVTRDCPPDDAGKGEGERETDSGWLPYSFYPLPLPLSLIFQKSGSIKYQLTNPAINPTQIRLVAVIFLRRGFFRPWSKTKGTVRQLRRVVNAAIFIEFLLLVPHSSLPVVG